MPASLALTDDRAIDMTVTDIGALVTLDDQAPIAGLTLGDLP